jgi:glycine/D-amino acid oxidase-like deaminating enzyme
MPHTKAARPILALASDPIRTHSQRSLWLTEAFADNGETLPQLRDHETADVCIVGGGFTGLWTAYELISRDPAANVTIVEAGICGGGASGRSAGFALSWWADFPALVQLCGTEAAILLAHRAEQAVAEIGSFCAAYGLAASCQQSGWLWAAASPAQVGAWEPTVKLLAELGEEPFELLSPREVAAVTGSPAHLAGLYEPSAATLQPALLARTLRRVLRESGVRIYEHSQVRSIAADAGPAAAGLEVKTATGLIRAGQVVLAVGAWAARIPEIAAGLQVLASDIVVTEPIPEQLAQLGASSGICISDARRLVEYSRATPDGRLLFGKGGSAIAFQGRIDARFDHPGRRTPALRSQLLRIYPTLWKAAVDCAWSGPIDYSLSGLPFLVRLRELPGVLVCAGFSGDGVGPSRLIGGLLAEMLGGPNDASVPVSLRTVPKASFRLPPEPLRFLGASAIRAAIQRKEHAEDHGLAPAPLLTRVAALDPLSQARVA